jgi:hypothetical protein
MERMLRSPDDTIARFAGLLGVDAARVRLWCSGALRQDLATTGATIRW